ncbi:divalent-cation tolerance protein CutA [Parvularcula lutaonensis]|uniref:Divalent-cation tolerance protein CutA n=1 Tax=Parvularcula lutaonensis TaxID=491923 RepID=A0ABV7MBT0_9PROT|nr:divalent-cation tolerance protein CutA [Parvularcula lutaonensis]GGY47361.1 divalent-cation tolerance protein CutA [Parvularcula lutaonensis]
MREIYLVTTTTASEDDARKLAHAAVEERLAACAQIFAIESVYVWEGVKQEREWRVEFKTTDERAQGLMRRLMELHPYEVPELVATRLAGASEAYAAWVIDTVL